MKKILLLIAGAVVVGFLGLKIYNYINGPDGPDDPPVPPVPPVHKTIEVERPALVNVYIDASGSMKDYFGKFDITNISNAITRLELVPDSLKVNYFSWGVPPQEIDRDKLTDKLVNKNFRGQSTDFDKIFSKMVEKSDGDTLAILISDGIISSSRDKTKNFEDFTRARLGQIKNNIQEVLKGSNRAMSIYRLKGDFKGNYLNKANKQVAYSGERPFFVFVIGNPAAVRYFDAEAREGHLEDIYKNAESIHFATAPKDINDGFYLQPDNGTDDMAGVEDFDRVEGTSEFHYSGTLGFRVSAMIPEWIKENYNDNVIRQMSKVTIGNSDVSIPVKIEGDHIIFDIPKDLVTKYADSCKKYTIKYTMTDPSAGAWDKYSTDDDTTPDDNTTFLLKDLISSIRLGLVGHDTAILSASITIIPEGADE